MWEDEILRFLVFVWMAAKSRLRAFFLSKFYMNNFVILLHALQIQDGLWFIIRICFAGSTELRTFKNRNFRIIKDNLSLISNQWFGFWKYDDNIFSTDETKKKWTKLSAGLQPGQRELGRALNTNKRHVENMQMRVGRHHISLTGAAGSKWPTNTFWKFRVRHT